MDFFLASRRNARVSREFYEKMLSKEQNFLDILCVKKILRSKKLSVNKFSVKHALNVDLSV